METTTKPRFALQWLIRRDVPEVMAIEQMSFDCPWTEEEMLRTLRREKAGGIVARDSSDAVVGFMVYDFAGPQYRILNLAVHLAWRRLGVGSTLIDTLKRKLTCSLCRNRITLRTSDTNLPAHLFFRSRGFVAIEVEREFYDSGADAYVMEFARPARRING